MFLNFLPSLRVFKYKTGDLGNNDEQFFSQPFEHLVPNTRLQEVKDGGACEFTRQLTLSGTYTRLERLNLAVSGNLINPRKDLYPYLKNMPILKKLTLKYADIGIQVCEVLHNNLPSLESFNLKDVNLNAGPLPRTISPATSLNALCYTFNDVQNNVDYPNWYLYMAKKYPNLKSLEADDFNLPYAGSEEATMIYRDGILPLYKNIGKRIHYFDAKNVPTELQVFTQLDSFGCGFSSCRLEDNDTRPIFTQLAHSKQAKHVRQLVIENTIITSASLFRNMTCLVSVNIDMDGIGAHQPINLTEYMDAFPPTLRDFLVNCTDLEINEIPTYTTGIQRLYIQCNNLSEKLGQVISTCFPKINDLYLGGKVEENIKIDVPTSHLIFLTLKSQFNGEPNGFLLNSTSDSQAKYYLGLQSGERIGRTSVKPVTEQELQNRIIMHVICASAVFPHFTSLGLQS